MEEKISASRVDTRQEKLTLLVQGWARQKVNISNQMCSADAQVKLDEGGTFVKFKFKSDEKNRPNIEAKKLPKKNGIVFLLADNMKISGEIRHENKIQVHQMEINYANLGGKEIERDVDLTSHYAEVLEKEQTNTETHSLNLGTGASAYGVDINIGYNVEWSAINREKHSQQQSKEVGSKIPVIIPPGGATYTFQFYRGIAWQDYTLDLALRGQVEISFDNTRPVIYENGIFKKQLDKTGSPFTKKVLVSIVDIFKDLQTNGKFPNASEWKFEPDKNIVSYQDKVSIAQFINIEIKEIAQANQRSPEQSAKQAETKVALEETGYPNELDNHKNTSILLTQNSAFQAEKETITHDEKATFSKNQDDNPDLSLLLNTSTIKKFSDNDRNQILNYISEKEEDFLYDFICLKASDSGVEIINQELAQYDEDYDLKAIIQEILKHKPDNSIIKYLDEEENFFIGKMLSLFDSSGSNSKNCEILFLKRETNSILFKLEDNSEVIIQLNQQQKITKASVFNKVDYKLGNYLTTHFSTDYDYFPEVKFNLKSSIKSVMIDSNNTFNLPSGGYKLLRSHERKEADTNLLKKLGYYLVSEKKILYEQSFKLEGIDEDNNYEIKLYDTGASDHIEVIDITPTINGIKGQSSKLTLSDLQKYHVERTYEQEILGINHDTAKEKIKIKERIIDENKIKLKKLTDINDRISMLVNELLEKTNEVYLDEILDHLVSHQLMTITDETLVNGEGGNIVDLREKLEKISTLYEEIGEKVSVSKILIGITLDANYARLINKEKNLIVSKTMDLLQTAFKHIELLKGRELILFLGNTGAGKSTSVNYFSGISLEEKTNKYGQTIVEIADKNIDSNSVATIGQSIGTSETAFVQGYNIMRKTGNINTDLLMLCDCPGFGDTRGIDYDLSTMLSIQQTINNAGSIRAIVLVEHYVNFLIGRGNPIIELFENIREKVPDAFKKNGKVHKSIFLIITKYSTHKKEKRKFEDILNDYLAGARKQLDQLLKRGTSHIDRFELDAIERKIAIWEMLVSMEENKQIEFITITNKIARKNLLKQYADAPTIEKEKFTNAMDGSQIQQHLGKYIQMSIHTWQRFIMDPYLKEIPSNITKVENDIKAREAEIEKKKEENNQKSQLIANLNEKIGTNYSKKEDLSFLKTNPDSELNDSELMKTLIEASSKLREDQLQEKK